MDNTVAKCVFCSLPKDRIVAENALAFCIRDAYPVTDGHSRAGRGVPGDSLGL